MPKQKIIAVTKLGFRLRMTSAGAALVELAIVSPLLLTIIFSGLEFARTLKSYEIMSTVSRETANSAFRDCAFQANTQTCTDGVVSNTSSYLASALPAAEMILSVYSMQGGVPVRTAISTGLSGSTHTPSGYQSKFSTANVTSQLNSLNTNNKKIAISEVFYKQSTVAKFVSSIFSYNPGVLYESTIY